MTHKILRRIIIWLAVFPFGLLMLDYCSDYVIHVISLFITVLFIRFIFNILKSL